jgi:hypothetical protein
MTEEKEKIIDIPEVPIGGKYDSWEFSGLTVADCMAEKIPPKEILSSGNSGLNMRWTSVIALINRKNTEGKRINTQISIKNMMVLYGNLMDKSFL